MPEISRFYGIVVKMFYDDHNPPHFHVEYNEYRAIITIEDGIADGGFGSAVLEEANRQQYTGRIMRLGVPDAFVTHGSVGELYKDCGIDSDSILQVIKECTTIH